ncbi:hypothetical protein J4E90_000280 [Alternaria incomplexa]|uniref:uncharacterized protein n=1 Tax=Alternaria incomplexa TaxID=1187928 RepID=UPI002220CA01|nr:uncharacterized protein J4E90_000280 [Alternaria incomplexa]XP_051304952.1 uncharacterized protein J4E86_002901 [Alternaria arbusti]KAI4921852.1 hypothetical protein J4E90_000280 [Alternaria incomplexa]KAI4959179.1 hypothetical protein J4E86_002901 [Alternaria arbusti]
MDDKNSPPLVHGDPARVLGVTELLENVLCNLSPGDILKSAQAVSKFWRDCVQGSTAVKKKCFLVADNMSEEKTDHRLFLGAGLPDLGKPLVADWSRSRHTRSISHMTVVTPATLRAFFADNPMSRRGQYKQAIQDYFERLDNDEELMRLTTNMGREERMYDGSDYDSRPYESLLDMSRANPLLRRSWKGKGSVVFTGYGKHLIFALGDNYPEACDYFTHIRTFLETVVHTRSADQSKQTWNTVQICSPAVTKLTVAIWLPGGPDMAQSFLNSSGVTMLDFAHMFIIAVRMALQSYDSVDVEHWLGNIHRHKRGGATWKRSMRLYKKERDLIEKLVDQLEKGRWYP